MTQANLPPSFPCVSHISPWLQVAGCDCAVRKGTAGNGCCDSKGTAGKWEGGSPGASRQLSPAKRTGIGCGNPSLCAGRGGWGQGAAEVSPFGWWLLRCQPSAAAARAARCALTFSQWALVLQWWEKQFLYKPVKCLEGLVISKHLLELQKVGQSSFSR